MSHAYRGELVISALIADRGERLGDEVAVLWPTGDVTYGELAERAARVAGALAELGLQSGDRVATMLESSPEYLAAWFGIAWIGGVEVPINHDHRGSFLDHVLRESGASALVIEAAWLDRLADLRLPDLRHVLVVGDTDAAAPPGVARHPFAAALAHDPAPRAPREERDLAYILYTSGTTGPSKGVMHSGRSALRSNVLDWVEFLGVTHEDVGYCMFPLFHGTGRNAMVSTTIYTGGRTALRSRFSLRDFWADIRATGATWFPYMGAVLHLLHAQEPRPDDAENPVRLAFGGAAPAEIYDAFERRFDLKLVETYGSTELGSAAFSPPGEGKPGVAGRPHERIAIEIHDEGDEPLAPGAPGEIVARPMLPDAIFAGYWSRPETTVEACRNLWFHTGDRGLIDEEGRVVFLDRITDSIRRRGENISSYEVERAVNGHADVLESAAYATPSELGEDEVMVAVVARPGRTLDPEELFRFFVRTMPRFTVPRFLRIVAQLPKTPSERVQKYLLRDAGVTPDSHDREAMGIEVPRRWPARGSA